MATESFFSNASLAYLASAGAGKDGKTYSIKPTDGTGDFTFSRGSNLAATRVGADGLIEKGRENLLLQSNNFDTTWTKSTAITATSGQSGYDGSSDAWLLERSDGSARYIQQAISLSGINTISFYAKADNENWVLVGTSSGNAQCYYNLSDGSIGTKGSLVVDANAEDIGSGWYRISMTINGTFTYIRIYPAVGNESVSGATDASLFIQDAQAEIGLAATDYIESGATTGKAGLLEDEPRFDYSGGATCPSLLLEPSRTTIIPYSEYFQGWNSNNNVLFSVNDATSPEGVTNATKITADGTSAAYFRHRTTVTAGDNTFSIFAKYDDCQYIAFRIQDFTAGDDGTVWFDIQNGVKAGNTGSVMEYDIEDYGNGWYRCYVVHNVDAADLFGYAFVFLSNVDENTLVTNGTSVDFYGGQWEAGSYPTSYIPNHSGGSVTRGADVCSVTGVSDLIGQTEGTIFLEFLKDNNDIGVISINDGSSSNRVYLGYSAANFIGQVRSGGGTAQAQFSSPLNVGEVYKCAIAYKLNDFVLYINGVQISTDTSGIVPVGMDSFSFYASTSTDAPMVSPVSQTLLFKERLSNTDLATLTTI